MSWYTFKNDMRWKLRYQLFRRVLPRLSYEPFTIQNLADRAWPIIAAATASHDYSSGIDIIDDSSEDAKKKYEENFQQHALKSLPLVVRNFAQDCPVTSWSMDDLIKEMGDHETLVKIGDYVSDFGQPVKVPISIADFANYLQGKEEFPYKDQLVENIAPYVGDEQISEINKMLPFPSLIPPAQKASGPIEDITTFWMGSQNTGTPLHCHHFCDTFLMQLIGRRRVVLIPPHQALLLGYVPHTINIGKATYDPFNPDPEKFPGHDQIHCLEIDLGPGDGLLIPGFWFHAISLSGPSLSASHFTRSSMPAIIGGGSCEPWQEPPSFRRGW